MFLLETVPITTQPRRCRSKESLRMMHGTYRTKTDHNSSPLASGSGELIMYMQLQQQPTIIKAMKQTCKIYVHIYYSNFDKSHAYSNQWKLNFTHKHLLIQHLEYCWFLISQSWKHKKNSMAKIQKNIFL